MPSALFKKLADDVRALSALVHGPAGRSFYRTRVRSRPRRHFHDTGPATGRADQAAVTLDNADGEIGGVTISNPPTRAEVQALRDRCEELADDVRPAQTNRRKQ